MGVELVTAKTTEFVDCTVNNAQYVQFPDGRREYITSRIYELETGRSDTKLLSVKVKSGRVVNVHDETALWQKKADAITHTLMVEGEDLAHLRHILKEYRNNAPDGRQADRYLFKMRGI